jgi:SAM-dependent methyltransferase
MHPANRDWWRICQEKYKPHFKDVGRVLEVGSFNVNGSVRDHFSNVATYIGVDWRPGPNVDMVVLAQDMVFDEQFNTIISASMLEHDPYWEASLTNMVKCLRDDGGLFLSWGAALNAPHELHTAPDGKFHALPAGRVIDLLRKLGMYIHDFRYEASMPSRQVLPAKGHGEVVLVAFKDKQYALGEAVMAPLGEKDK